MYGEAGSLAYREEVNDWYILVHVESEKPFEEVVHNNVAECNPVELIEIALVSFKNESGGQTRRTLCASRNISSSCLVKAALLPLSVAGSAHFFCSLSCKSLAAINC